MSWIWWAIIALIVMAAAEGIVILSDKWKR